MNTETSYQGTNRTIGEVADRLISTSTKGSPLSRSRASQEDTRYLQQDASSNIDLSRTNSYGSSVEERNPSTRRSLSEAVNKSEERITQQGRPGVSPALQDMSDRSHELPHQQESRYLSRLFWFAFEICDQRFSCYEQVLCSQDSSKPQLSKLLPASFLCSQSDQLFQIFALVCGGKSY